MFDLGTENVGSSYGSQLRVTQDLEYAVIGGTPQTINAGNCRVAGVHNPTGGALTVTLKDGSTTIFSASIAAGAIVMIPTCRFTTSLVASAGTGCVVFWSPGAYTFPNAVGANAAHS